MGAAFWLMICPSQPISLSFEKYVILYISGCIFSLTGSFMNISYHILCLTLLLALSLSACVNDEMIAPANTVMSGCTEIQSYALTTCDKLAVGIIEVANDDNYVYVAYHTDPPWYLVESHLYLGLAPGIPVNRKKVPKVAKFPFSKNHDGINSFGYTVPIHEDWDPCLAVAAHASIVKVDLKGNVLLSENVWSSGSLINTKKGSWATVTNYCVETCKGK